MKPVIRISKVASDFGNNTYDIAPSTANIKLTTNTGVQSAQHTDITIVKT